MNSTTPVRRWRKRVAVGEGWRSWRHGRWVTVLLTALATAAVAGPAVIDAVTVAAAVTAEQRWVEAGGRVLVASNVKAGLSRAACERLGTVDGVEAAVAVARQPPAAGTAAVPGRSVPITAVTAGISRFLNLPPTEPGVIVSAKTANTIGRGNWIILQTGDRPAATAAGTTGRPAVPIPDRPLRVAAVADVSLLGDTYDYGVLLPVPATGLADECFVRTDAAHWRAVRNALPALFGPTTPSAPIVVTDRLASGVFARDYAAEYRSRPTARLAYFTGLAVGVLWLLMRWINRTQDALYQTLGASSGIRAMIRASEFACVMSVATVLGIGIALTTTLAMQQPVDVTLHFILRSAVLTILSASAIAVGWLVLPQPNPLSALKDR